MWVFLVSGCGMLSGDRRKQSFLHKGNLAFRDKMYQEALRYYGEAFRLDSCYAIALHNYGVVLQKIDKSEEALQYFDRAIVCDSLFVDAYFSRAMAYIDLGEAGRSLADTDLLVRLYPDSMHYSFIRGIACSRAGLYLQSVESFSRVIQADSANWEAWINLGNALFFAGEPEQAADAASRGLSLRPTEANGWNLLGLIALEQENYDSAALYLSRGLSLDPEHAYLLNNRAFLHMMRGDMASAHRDLRASQAIDPNNAWLQRNFGLYHFLQRNYSEAIGQFEKSLQTDPSVPLTAYYLGNACWSAGMADAACASWSNSAARGEESGVRALDRFCR